MNVKKVVCIIVLLCFCAFCCSAKVSQYKLKVIKEYPHDRSSYTQGLFFYQGQLIETCGRYGHSSLAKIDLSTGKPLFHSNFDKKYFVEGSVVFDSKLYILTWQNNIAFIYDAQSFEHIRSVRYAREGWGITTDGKQLIASDGSSVLSFMDGDLKLIHKLEVSLNGRPLRNLNELEYINGKIWANLYLTDMIAIINPQTGIVEGLVDCAGLLPDRLRDYDTDVLNGIAYNEQDSKIYLTGKNWPRLYEIKLITN